MEQALKDSNSASSLLGVLNTTGTSTVKVKANPTNHGLKVDDNTTGTDHGPANALHDDNFVTSLMAVSSADGVTPVAVYTNSSGQLLIKST